MAYQLGVERWVLETRLANTPEELEAAANNRPDPVEAARDVWQAIAPEINREWILPHAAWFIQMADNLGVITEQDGSNKPFFHEELAKIFAALREFHLKADGLAPICLALAQHGGPDRLGILEKIRDEHPDNATRGVAALSQAIAMKSLGDEPAVIAKRLELLREAIIKSADVALNDHTTVAQVAQEELYIIRNLTKGRTAPDLTGTDTAGRPMKLSDHAGKLVVLLFWSATDASARDVIEFASTMQDRLRGRPVEIIGVNVDITAILRPLEADGTVSWRNFSDPEGKLAHEFRVGATPLCYVLGVDRVIHHVGSPGAFIELAVLALLEGEKEK